MPDQMRAWGDDGGAAVHQPSEMLFRRLLRVSLDAELLQGTRFFEKKTQLLPSGPGGVATCRNADSAGRREIEHRPAPARALGI